MQTKELPVPIIEMARDRGLAVARRAVVSVVVPFILASCGKPSAPPPPVPPSRPESVRVVIIRLDDRDARALLKRFPSEPDPADEARDSKSCRHASGEWAPYVGGPLIIRPNAGEHADGMMCWRTRPPRQFPDAGKRCAGQSDCLGNCRSEFLGDRTWSLPVCQRNVDEETCGPVFDGGDYHWVDCPVF